MGKGVYLKRFSGTIIAVIIFAVLLGGIFLFSAEEKKESVRKIFPALEKEEVLSIMLKSPGREINLDKDGEEWFVTGSENASKADAQAIQKFIDEVKALEIIQTLPSQEKELSEFGLQEPASEFMIITDKADYYILIGDDNPGGTATYIYDLDKERLMITDSKAAGRLAAHAARDFEDKKVIAISPSLVNRVVLRVGNFFTVFHKNEGTWTAEPLPEGQTLDQSKAEELITVLSEIEIKDVVNTEPDNPEDYGFDLPSAEIEIFQNGGSYIVLFGKRRDEDEHYIKFDSDSAIYSTSKENFKKLPKNVEDITR